MKKVVRYTSYEGSSVDQLFVGSDIFAIDVQEVELDEYYAMCYGIGGFTKETLIDETTQYLGL